MEQAELIGYTVLAIITLGSFTVVISRFTQPINELRIVIQELRDCINSITKENARRLLFSCKNMHKKTKRACNLRAREVV